MKLRMYCVKDSAAEIYDRPWFARAHGEAIRTFEQAFNQEDSPFRAAPEHFSLWYVGDFNQALGMIEFEGEFDEFMPVCLARGVDIVGVKPKLVGDTNA